MIVVTIPNGGEHNAALQASLQAITTSNAAEVRESILDSIADDTAATVPRVQQWCNITAQTNRGRWGGVPVVSRVG